MPRMTSGTPKRSTPVNRELKYKNYNELFNTKKNILLCTMVTLVQLKLNPCVSIFIEILVQYREEL